MAVDFVDNAGIVGDNGKGQPVTTGDNIKRWRERRALSQEGLGELAGISANTIWRIETEGRAPRPTTLRKIADALKVDPAVLLDGKATTVAD
jgi:transcriptional regulator with XRE-family HTH domain